MDREYTPQPWADAACRFLLQYGDFDCIWEPHAGRGAFVEAATETWTGAEVWATDIAPPADMHWPVWDARDGPPDGCAPQMIIGNPPFAQAADHIDTFLSTPDVCIVAMLLRVGFLGSIRRAGFWERNPPGGMHTFFPRPSFRKGRTDSQEYAMFVWHNMRPTKAPHPFTRIGVQK